jgi:hypothetical protein
MSFGEDEDGMGGNQQFGVGGLVMAKAAGMLGSGRDFARSF